MSSETVSVIIGWGLGTLTSGIIYLYKENKKSEEEYSSIAKILEATKKIWDEVKDLDQLTRLEIELSSILSDLNEINHYVYKTRDAKIIGSYYKLKQNYKKYISATKAGNRGLFHYYRDDIDKIYRSELIEKLHLKHCVCRDQG